MLREKHMNKLIIMIGAPGSGKSTFLNKLGLQHHSLSMDVIRECVSSAELSVDGRMQISQNNNAEVYNLFVKFAKQRIIKGETLAIDSTIPSQEFIDALEKHLLDQRYEIAIVDLSNLPLDVIKKQNSQRFDTKQVNDLVIDKIQSKIKNSTLNLSKFKTTTFSLKPGQQPLDLISSVYDWLKIPTIDLSKYEEVVHIGDLQGCHKVLQDAIPTFDNKKAYIFVGDLVDRGIENGTLLKWLLPYFDKNENFFLIFGNHEDHLWRYAFDKESFSTEFKRKTKQQLDLAQIDKQMLQRVLLKSHFCLPYKHNNINVIVSHAGISGIPNLDSFGNVPWHYISIQQFKNGVGAYEMPVDQIWQKNSNNFPLPFVQVHGHRNHQHFDIDECYPSFNLEHSVEYGGKLAICTLKNNSWNTYYYKNEIFATWRDRFGEKKMEHNDSIEEQIPHFVKLPVPFWIKRSAEPECTFDPAVLKSMKEHEGVKEKCMKSHPHICSLNFSKDVFFNASWDDVVVKARGLFYNNKTNEIVARGYDKFFNIDETSETSLPELSKNIKFPFVGYVKENGYLGNLGYDSETDSLFFATKSTNEGDFSQWFVQIFNSLVDDKTKEQIKNYLRNAEASMVFEVIDPQNDPHMIEYEKPELVLLDVFHRSTETEKLPFDDLVKVGTHFNLKTKAKAFNFNSFSAFEGWHRKSTQDLTYQFGAKDIEGFVFEDSNGFQTKIKLPFYSFWKRMRSSKDSFIRLNEQLTNTIEKISNTERKSELQVHQEKLHSLKNKLKQWEISDLHPLAMSFKQWCKNQPLNSLNQDIISLRNQFKQSAFFDPASLSENWIQFPKNKEEEPKSQSPSIKTKM